MTGASTADLAVILIDARKGVLTQTRRYLLSLPPARQRHIVLAVNKMDLIGWVIRPPMTRSSRPSDIFAESIGIAGFTPVPVLGFHGDINIAGPSGNTPWYSGRHCSRSGSGRDRHGRRWPPLPPPPSSG